VIDAAATLAWVDRDLAAILCPREHPRQNRPGVVGLALRPQRKLIAPIEEDSPRARIGKRLDRSIAESLFDPDDVLDVVGARAVA
jgi:hypothetical protein